MDLSRLSDDLSFVRAAVTRSARFHAVSHYAVAATGALAVLCCFVTASILAGVAVPRALPPETVQQIGLLWGGLFLGCAAINALAMWRNLRGWSDAERYAVLSSLLHAMVPVMLAGGVVTVGLVQMQAFPIVPVCWLACYGAAQMAASFRSVPELYRIGAFSIGCAFGALLVPGLELAWLGLGLGIGHLVLAIMLARRADAVPPPGSSW